MKRKIGVLFDLDGVLVDSEGEYSNFWGLWGEDSMSVVKPLQQT